MTHAQVGARDVLDIAVEDSAARCFERRVAASPDTLAVKDRWRTLTYGQLNAAANGLARVLRHAGDGHGAVPMVLGHDASVLVGILGALKAGGIAAPLDARHPAARLEALVERCESRVVVTDERHRALAHEVCGSRAEVLTIEETASDRTASNLDLAIDPGAPAYLLYTSGTTGTPKGVLHSHRNLVHRAYCQVVPLGLRPGERYTWFASASVGQGASNVFNALITGGTLFPHAPREDGLAAVPAWLRRERISIFTSPATLFRSLVALLHEDDRFPDVRVVRLGSERVRHDDVRAFARHFPPPSVFVQQYASTETSGITAGRIDDADDNAGGALPAGRPLPDKYVHILDEAGRELSVGEVGEIAVRSRFLALGYWRDPEQTAKAFRPVPGSPDERIYLTGDLGRLRPDGRLEHLGRKDSRVKVRGLRIELEELEWTLRQHPGVLQAAATASRAHDDEDRLVAYYVVKPGAVATTEQLRTFMTERLPASIVPAWFVRLDSLPLTPSGKIDRRSLPEPKAFAEPDGPHVGPRNAIEEALTDLWAAVLGPQQVSVHDAFLNVGGDSLRATRLLARVLDRWAVDVSLAEFMDAPTIAALAETIARRMAKAQAHEAALLEEVLDEFERARRGEGSGMDLR